MGSISDVSIFDKVSYIPPDAIFELTQLYNVDSHPKKVNLGQGTYKDENGNPWILPSVRAAKEKIKDANHEYLPILGLPQFRSLGTKLVYGDKSQAISEKRVAACQALSGTGALHLAGAFLYQTLPKGTPVYITKPTWSNHRQVFETIGFEVIDFEWYSSKTSRLNLPAILDALSQAPSGSVFVFHASAHNPSGSDPSEHEWQQIAQIVKDRKLVPLFDSAYLGITSGSYANDAFAIRHFVNDLGLEAVVCASFAKNMGLYGERVGHLSVVTKTEDSAKAVESRLAQLTRAEISNPPAFGARITAAILGDQDLSAQWQKDLVTMSSRIAEMRQALYDGLVKLGTPGDWKPITEQKGMFCILGLSLEKVIQLRENHHIYMADSSRVSIAGLNWSNVDYVAAAIDDVENLERHRRSRHGGSGRRPFECFLCRSRFSRRDVCKRHAERCRGKRDQQPASSDGHHEADQLPVPNLESPPFPSINDFSRPVILDSPASNVSEPSLSSSEMETNIASYFEYFHPSLPLLHRPTIGTECPDLLKNIIIAIGGLYTARTVSKDDAAVCLQKSQALWHIGWKELNTLMESDWAELRRTWTLQASLLYITYGAFMGDATQYRKSKNMLRSLVDATQELGMLRQSVATSSSRSWIRACDRESWTDTQQLNDCWMLYVGEESLKLSMYTLLFLDYHVLSPCNIRALTSPLELDWELPLSSLVWEAENSLTWMERLADEPRVTAMLEDKQTLGLACPSTKSLTMATQSLMSDAPSPILLSALSASPMAAIFVLTNVEVFVRDFTRSYYQLPPNLADPSAYHIFTQSQNRQLNAALRHISWLISERNRRGDATEKVLWTTIERMTLSVRISLCKPDDLLIGGIVDSSVIAGLATATHLTLGLYAGSRRSLQSLLQSNSGDDALLVILNEAMGNLSSMYNSTWDDALREAPWTTITSYRILLTIWRSLRWASAEMRRKEASPTEVRRRYDASTMVFNAITEGVVDQSVSTSGGDDVLFTTPDVGEQCFARMVHRFWQERNAWAIGSSMATVLEEIIALGY